MQQPFGQQPPMQQPFGQQPPMQQPFGQPQQPPAPGGAPMTSPFGAQGGAPPGVRASPFANAGTSAPPTGPPTSAFPGGAGGYGGMAPPPSMADMAARAPAPAVAPPPTQSTGFGAPAAPTPTPGPSYGGNYGAPANQPDASMSLLLRDLDSFNSPKEFVRGSVGRLPHSLTNKQKLGVPLGIVLQPLAPSGAHMVPDVNHGAVGSIIRCKQCRTYVNPFVKWEANGSRWTCNLCGFSQGTPNEYYGNLDQEGRRADRYDRPELSKGAVEYIAPGEYMVRPPQPPVFMFVIDVSYASVSTGMLHAVVDAIKHVLTEQLITGGQRLQVGIMTYDTSLHFYNLNANLSAPQMLVVADLEDLFLPLPDDILVNASESEGAIMNLLDSLPTMFQETKISENCMGSAVKGAFLAMKHIGGKLMVFGSCIPSVGENKLKTTRDNPRMLGTDREKELLIPVKEAGRENPPYKELANELTRAQISVELFMGANAYVDLASIAPLAKFTGGDLRYYPQFHIQTHGMKLKSEIIHVCTRKTGWEAVMRVRVSRGWKITNFYGHLFIRGQDLLVVPNCHADQTFAVTIDMEDNVNPDPVLYIQSALLYTNSDGERRIRVHTWASPTTQNFNEILNSVDVQATTLMLSHMALETSLTHSLNEGRNKLQTQCQAIVQSMAQSETMQFLPMYIMGMLKSAAFRGGTEIGADMRTAIWSRMETLSVPQLSSYFYPRLLTLHDMPPHVGVEDENGVVVLPDKQNLTKDIMTQDGVYLLEDGEIMMIWIGRSVDPNFLSSVFGVSNIDELNTDEAEHTIGTLESPLSKKVGLVLRQIRTEQEVPYMQLYIMKGGDGHKEVRFFNSLIEDRSNAPGMNTTYMEFLQRMGYRPPATAAAPPQGQMAPGMTPGMAPGMTPGMTPGMAPPPAGGMQPGMGAPPMAPPGIRR